MEKEKTQDFDTFWDKAPWWGEYLAQYREALKFARGARALDIGCGFGYGSRYLFDHGAIQVTGIDISADHIHYAQRKYARDGVDFKVQSAEDMSFASKSFDLVTCFQVLEKSTKPDELIHSIYRVLDKNGVAIITTVNRQRFSKLVDAPVEKEHMLEFDIKELKDILKKHVGKFEIAGMFCTREGDSKIFRNSLTEKIPHTVRDTVAKKVFGQSYFPSEKEFVLKKEAVHEAPLFYVTCKKV